MVREGEPFAKILLAAELRSGTRRRRRRREIGEKCHTHSLASLSRDCKKDRRRRHQPRRSRVVCFLENPLVSQTRDPPNGPNWRELQEITCVELSNMASRW